MCLRHIIFSAPTTAVALPVHDAVAVTQDNADWTKEAMLRAWFEHGLSMLTLVVLWLGLGLKRTTMNSKPIFN